MRKESHENQKKNDQNKLYLTKGEKNTSD